MKVGLEEKFEEINSNNLNEFLLSRWTGHVLSSRKFGPALLKVLEAIGPRTAPLTSFRMEMLSVRPVESQCRANTAQSGASFRRSHSH